MAIGGGIGALLAGLGGITQGYDRARRQQLEEQQAQQQLLDAQQNRALSSLKIDDLLRNRQAATAAAPFLLNGGVGDTSATLGLGAGGAPMQPAPSESAWRQTPASGILSSIDGVARMGAAASPAAMPGTTLAPGGALTGGSGYPFPNTGANRQFPALAPNTTGYSPASGPGYPPAGQPPAAPDPGVKIGGGMPPGAPIAPASPQVGEAPPAFDPRLVAQRIKQQNPSIDDQTLVAAVDLVGQRVAPQYKAAFDRWKALAEIQLRQGSNAETGRHNVVEEGLGQGRLAEEQRFHTGEMADRSTGRDIERGRAAETGRHNLATEKGAAARLQRGVETQQAKTGAAVTQLETLADQARRLYAMVEANPRLVGGRGIVGRVAGSVKEQLLGQPEDPEIADFKSKVQLLQTQLQRPLLGSRYFSGAAQNRLNEIVPGLQRLDNPTLVKSSLQNIAETLEGIAATTKGVSAGIGSDYSGMSDAQIMQQLGIGGAPPEQ